MAAAGVPMVFTTTTADVFNVTKVTLLWLAVTVSLAAFVGVAASERRWPPRPRIAAPIGLVVVVTAAATVVSTSPAVSAVGQYRRYDGLASAIAYAVAALLVMAWAWERPARLGRLLGAGLVGLGLATAYSLIQALGLDWYEWLDANGDPVTQAYGTLGNSNFSGAFFALGVPMVLCVAHRAGPGRRRVALLASLVPLGVVIWASASRGGFLALVVGVAVTGWLDGRLVPRVVTWGATAASAVGLAVIAGFLATGSLSFVGPVGELDVLRSSTLEQRSALWEGAIGVVADDPVFGTGPDTFLTAYPPHRPARSGGDDALVADEPHNILLDRAAGTGLVGLGAFLWLLARLTRQVLAARTSLSGEDRALVAGFAGLLAGYLAQGLVSIDAPPLALWGWLAVGALAALVDPVLVARRSEPAPTGQVVPRALTGVGLGGLLVVVLLVGSLAVRPLVADTRMRDGIEGSNAGDPPAEVVADFDAARAWQPLEPAYQVRAGQQWQIYAATVAGGSASEAGAGIDPFVDDALQAATTRFHDALDLRPSDPYTLRFLGGLYRQWALSGRSDGWARADEAYAEAVALDADNWQARGEYGVFLLGWGTAVDGPAVIGRSVEHLERSVELRPSYDGGWLALAAAHDALGDATAADSARSRADG